jgi:hypothetical protein
VPQYAVTVFVVAFSVENPPVLLLVPVYVPDSTPLLIVPLKVNPPPDRLTASVAESKDPVNAVVLPPARWTLPVADDTVNGPIEVAAMVVWIVTDTVPVWLPDPARVP